MDVIKTERLLLRPLTRGDADALHRLYGDLELMRYIIGRARRREETLSRLEDHIADHERHGFGLCAAIERSSGEMIGRCGLEPVETEDGLEGDIAWLFLEEHWGKGFATEFGRAMIDYAFAHLPLRRIFARADHENPASIRVMEKLGMTPATRDEREVVYEIRPPERQD